MSERGPVPPSKSFYGRTVKLEVTTYPGRLAAAGILLGLLGAASVIGGALWVPNLRGFFVLTAGLFLTPLGPYFLYGAIRLRQRGPLFLKLGVSKLELPRGGLIWNAKTEVVSLADIKKVVQHANRGEPGVRLVKASGEESTIHASWLPKAWSMSDFGLLLHLRALGARRDLHRTQQTALEAHVFEGDRDTLGVVIDQSEKRPRVMALVSDMDDYKILMAEPSSPSDALLVLPSDELTQTRRSLKGALVSALPLDPRLVRSG